MAFVVIEKHGPVAVVKFNRPEAMNALGAPGDGEEIRDACEAVAADREIRCVVLTGEGKAFSTGWNPSAAPPT